MRFWKILGRTIGWLLVLVLLAVIGIGIYAYQTYAQPILALKRQAQELADASSRDDFSSALTSVVYDAGGEVISVLRSGRDAYYLRYDELPRYAVDVMLVTEDKKFYSHSGVDLIANVRAAIALIRNNGTITQGGSTITQQLARSTYLSYEVTYERKIVEIFLAWELEKKYSKQDILEFYMNNIYFANSCYGIQAAALTYFGKSANELSLSQTVFLCAIPNSPDLYNPYVHFDNTLKRRDRMLLQMLEDGKITEGQYREALAEEIVLSQRQTVRHNYVETYTYYCAIRALMEESGFVFCTDFSSEEEQEAYDERYAASYAYWQQQIYTRGFRIYTSIDLEQQELLQRAVDEGTAEFQEKGEDGIYELQAAAVCIDNRTGCVTAIVGGREAAYAGYTLNRAYQSFRQPGSSIKPLIIYTPLFERGLSPDDIVVDEKFAGGPSNSGGSYAGEITVRRAVELSKNTVAWKLLQELTPELGLSYLERMGFRRIVSTDYVPAAALGGLTYGASTLEMTSAYAAIANGGVYRTPTCVVRITDSEGNDLIGEQVRETRIYEENAARVMTDVLEGVLTVGTAKNGALKTAIAAGKTGTTNNKRDGWFIGYTAYYTVGVWVGCDLPKTVSTLSGSTYPLTIWKTYMEELHEGLALVEFPKGEPIPATRFGTQRDEEGDVAGDDAAGSDGTGTTGDAAGSDAAGSDGTGSAGDGAGDDAAGSDGTGTTGDAAGSDAAGSDGTESTGDGAGEEIEDGRQFLVTPPPHLSWGDEDAYDPTER